MNHYKLTANITFDYNLNGFNQKTLKSIFSALSYLDLLNELSKQDNQPLNLEDYYYNKIIDSLREGIKELDDDERTNLTLKLDEISEGIYDFESVSYSSMSSDLIFGKVFSPENNYEKRFGGAFGLLNKESNSLLYEYDKIAEENYLNFPHIASKGKKDFIENKSDIKCIDIIRYGGELNKTYKPISIFYAGRKSKLKPAQPKVVLFTNIYYKRYEIISEQLGNKYIKNFYSTENINREILNTILLFWLRGHDIGHFFGADNLGDSMKDSRRVYYILHELKSDIVSLYILKNSFKKLFTNVDLRVIYMVFLSEVFRYMRRGGYLKYADGGSAYLAYKFFLDSGSVKLENKSTHSVNVEILSNDIDKLCKYLIDIFEKGDADSALEFSNRWGNLGKLDDENLTDQLEFLNDYSIPFNLNIQNP